MQVFAKTCGTGCIIYYIISFIHLLFPLLKVTCTDESPSVQLHGLARAGYRQQIICHHPGKEL